jgi:hypothetical protein
MDMGYDDHSAGTPSGQPPDDDILATLTSMIELRARVGTDRELGAIEIQVAALNHGGFGKCTVLLNPIAAVDLSMRLLGAAMRLRRETWQAP